MFDKNQQSLSLYAIPRHIRIAFLLNIDNQNFDKIFDSIVDFNLSMWGGRYNSIIPIKDGKIDLEYLNLLKFSDPDIIYSFEELENELLNYVKNNTSTLLIKKHRAGSSFYIDLSFNQIGIQNLFNMVKKYPLFFSEYSIPIIKNLEKKNLEQSKFLKRNFGIDDDRISTRHFNNYFETFLIPDDLSEKDTFTFFQNKNRILFPFYFSSYYSDFFECKESLRNDFFTIFIGDYADNWINNWNRIFYLPSFRRDSLNQICLPELFFENQDNVISLANFLIRGGFLENNREVHFVGSSAEEYKSMIGNALKNKIGLVSFAKKIDYTNIKLERTYKYFENLKELKHIVINNLDKFFIQNPFPSFLSNSEQIHSSSIYWMIDFKIQYRPEKFTYTNSNYFWKLPRYANHLTRLFFKNLPGRVNDTNYVSVYVHSELKNIEISIPSDFNLLYNLLLKENNSYYKEDLRKNEIKDLSDISISDKGIYSLAFLQRFPNNWEAARFVEIKFWRVLFEQMNKIDETETKKKLVPIKNRLSRIFDSSSPLDIDWLSDFILKKSRELKTKIEFISYNELLSRFHRERENVIKESEQPNGHFHDDIEEKEELNYAINELLEYSILFQGINPKCINCDSKNWYSTEEIKDVLVCKGCMTKFRLKAEEPWSYKLNTLVANAITYHGVIPVIWAQNYLLNRCESFISIPGVKFYQENSSEPSEIDLVAIKDGNLLLVELKTKAEEFGKPDLENFASICKIIKPQVAILGSIDGEENKLKQKGKELEKLINHSDIEVKTIYPDEYFFKSSWLL